MMAAMPPAFPKPEGVSVIALEGAIVAGCIRQEPRSYRAFVTMHERKVFALLSRMLGRSPDVDDLAQETFARAFAAFPRFDPAGTAKPATWLLTIATRLALDARKRRRIDVATVDVEMQAASGGQTPEASLERRQLGEALARAAATLPDDQRAALVLGEAHGFSIAEIAEALGVPEATAKTKLFRAREKMRAALTEWRTS